MKHEVSINVSKTETKNVMDIKVVPKTTEALEKAIFGNPGKMTIIIPGDTVESICVKEIKGGGKTKWAR